MGALRAVRRKLLRGLGSAALLGLCAAGLFTVRLSAATHPASSWERAVADREAFEASGSRSKSGFARVMDEFRAVYYTNPAAAHAPDAVYAVAELLAEQGRALGDRKSLRAAVGQYEFLRTQYPGSGLRVRALLAEGNIEGKDLGDPSMAHEKYAALLREAPRSASAAEARSSLAELENASATATQPRARRAEPAAAGLALTEENARRVEAEGRTQPAAVEATGVEGSGVAEPADSASMPVEAAPVPPEPAARSVRPVAVSARRGSLAEVTGIRHWSTPTYTRVAIDLGDEVTFEAARVPHPDRIYFDLHGARLGQELVGKSFDVTDDGFLKKIRAAQSSADVTRVVLDVNDVTEYSAFLLPNPYRLIIDIHGAKSKDLVPGTGNVQPSPTDLAEVPVAPATVRQASVAATQSGLPAMAPTEAESNPPPTARPERTGRPGDAVPAPRTGVTAKPTLARPVPNTVAVKAPATTTEVAAVSDTPGRVDATRAPTSRPVVAVVRVRPATAQPDPAVPVPASSGPAFPLRTGRADAAPGKAADKTADGETSLIRALGLKIGRIVIDAGHGGHDSGTLGVGGVEEKDVVLDVALRLGKLLHDRLGAEIIYTRSDDTFIPLETRTAIANKAQADLFISIHANSSQDESARGVEVYYLNFTSDPNALDVAARENAVSGSSVHQLSDLVKKITLKDKIAESREFAADVDSSLYAGLTKGNDGLKNRGVKKAPFVVLIGANMPSILAEISFVTNGKDAAQLRQPDYRERVAESLFNGVARYESGLAGAKPVPTTRAAVK